MSGTAAEQKSACAARAFDFLWRNFHQIRRSPQRIDIPGSLPCHPLETAAYTSVPLAVTVPVLGLDPLAAFIAGHLFTFAGTFRHWNVLTPQRMGYLLQRPESHCVHHREAFHCCNFADHPRWDISFGTCRNPRQVVGECGFNADAERTKDAMPAFAAVNGPLDVPGKRGGGQAIARRSPALRADPAGRSRGRQTLVAH